MVAVPVRSRAVNVVPGQREVLVRDHAGLEPDVRVRDLEGGARHEAPLRDAAIVDGQLSARRVEQDERALDAAFAERIACAGGRRRVRAGRGAPGRSGRRGRSGAWRMRMGRVHGANAARWAVILDRRGTWLAPLPSSRGGSDEQAQGYRCDAGAREGQLGPGDLGVRLRPRRPLSRHHARGLGGVCRAGRPLAPTRTARSSSTASARGRRHRASGSRSTSGWGTATRAS